MEVDGENFLHIVATQDGAQDAHVKVGALRPEDEHICLSIVLNLTQPVNEIHHHLAQGIAVAGQHLTLHLFGFLTPPFDSRGVEVEAVGHTRTDIHLRLEGSNRLGEQLLVIDGIAVKYYGGQLQHSGIARQG